MRNEKLRTVRLKAGYWSHEDDEEQGCIFHLSGLTPDEKKVQLQINGFTPFIYLELPNNIKWNENKCKAVFEYFQGLLKDRGPIKYKMYEKDKLHFKKRTNTIFMTFPSWKACRDFGYKCSRTRSLYIPKVGNIYGGDFIVHEQNIDAIIKFTAAKKIPLAGWIEVKESIPPEEESLTEEERKFSSADIDLYSNFSQVKHCTEEESIVNPEYCSFDGEMYSKNHNAKLSDPDIKENVVFQLSMIFGRLNNQEREKYLLTLFDPLDIEGVNVIRCKTEKELLLKFTSLIKEKDPDLFIGYNIMKFDWGYLIARAEKLGIYPRFMELSRIIGRRAELKKNSWSSSAYGDQEFRYPDCHGRINMDVILEVERNYRMPEYGLNAVADKFLGEKKDPVTARHMFMLYQMTEELLPIVRNKTLNEREVKRIRKRIQELLLLRFFKNAADEIKKYRKRLLVMTSFNIEETVREAMTIVGKYCVKDSMLPIDLVEKLNLYTTMEQMSNVMHVPMSYLHTRGQQIKVLAQVYRETISNNMIIPNRDKKKDSDEDEKYQGAIVIEANPGDYDNVCMLDFASLYPSMMITYNICYSSILEENDPTPDEECHVLEWEDHCGCFVGTTPVTVSGDRSILIKDLANYQGDIQALDEKGTGTKLYCQTSFFPQGIKKCVKLTLEDGSVLECTPDHRIRTSTGEWMEAQNLILGETEVFSGYTSPIFDMENEGFGLCGKLFFGDESHKFAKLAGLLCSDGCISGGHVNVYSGHHIDIENIIQDIEYLTGEKPIVKKENYGWGINITGWLRKIFMEMPGVMKGNKQKQLRTLPEFLENASENIIRSFLSGLFGGDGHTFTFSPKAQNIGTIKLSWCSEKIEYLIPVFNKLQKYLDKCGINSTITQCKNERIISIPVSDSIKFKEKIGFGYCCHKSMRLEAGCRYLRYRENVWNQQERIIEHVKMKREELRSQKKKYSIDMLTESAIQQEKFFYNDYYGHPTPSQMTEFLLSRRRTEKPMFSRKHFPGPMEYMERIGARDLFASNGESKYGVDINSNSLPLFKLKVIGREDIGEHEVFDIEVKDSHSFLANGVVVHNCEHDPQKRKRKKEDVMCGSHSYRFRKAIIGYDEVAKKITRKHEGLMPRLERNLLASRKVVKKEMFKAEARLKMQRGQATEKDIEYYRKIGLEIIEKESLGPRQEMMLEVTFNVLNAKQLAIKVSANSAYGAMGAKTGFIPFIPGAASVTAMGRKLITMAIDKIKATWNISKLVYGDSVTSDTPVLCRSTDENGVQKIFMTPISQLPGSEWSIFPDGKCYSNPLNNLEVWSDKGFTKIKSIMKHKTNKKIYRITSHTGVVKVTEDHSLLYDNEVEVRPRDVSVGENLLTKTLPPIEGAVDHSDISWAWGLFYGDGSCGYYDCPSGKKHSWAINNQNKDYLSKAKNILSLYYPNHGFKILETMRSSSVYKLVCTGKVSEIVKEWRDLFYDPETRYKMVPNVLWSTNLKTREEFFEGYYCADGDKDKHGYTRFDNKGDIGSAGLFYLAKSLGYKASCNTRKDKLNITRITLTKSYQRKNPGVIKKIEDFGKTDDYVYDLETENHHFSAGVGELVVHNTDSCLFKFLGCNLEESFEMAEKASIMTTHYLKCNVMEIPEDYSLTTTTKQTYNINKINSKHSDFANLSYEDKIKVVEYESIPIDLEFESMYGRLLLLTKKRYVAYIVNKKGETTGVVKKGVVLARRDNSGYLRLAYKKLTDCVLDQKSEEEIMNLLYDEVHKLFTRKVPDTHLIIYMGVKSVMNYAKKKENKIGKNVTDVYYLDRDKVPIDDPIGPLDPRLDYPNLPQCLLSLKMMRRGTDIPPNTRLEFLYLENPDASHQGDKAEDYTYYIENKEVEEFKPDYLHYIEKQLSRPVTELLSVKYPRESILYEKLEDAFKRMLTSPDINELKKNRLARVNRYEKYVDYYEDDVIIGWKVIDEISQKFKTRSERAVDKRDTVYKFKNKEAKATFVIDSSRKRGMNEFNPSRKAEAELIDISKKWKARNILDKLYKQYGVKKRPCKRPTQVGEKLRKNTKVIFIQSFKDQEKGSHAKVIDNRETEDKRYYYDLLMEGREELIIKDVPRRILATYYLRDSTIMKDILNARSSYKSVIDHLDDLFNPFVFEE